MGLITLPMTSLLRKARYDCNYMINKGIFMPFIVHVFFVHSRWYSILLERVSCRIVPGTWGVSACHVNQQGEIEADDDQPDYPEHGRSVRLVGIAAHDLFR